MTAEQIALFLVRLIAGTGVFLVGVYLLTENIEQLATNRIKELFAKTAGKKLANVGIGALVTALLHSSGVTTVLIVGFVNIGAVSLSQATAMIMGANIGTTFTAQVAALSAFPITTYVQVLAGVGILFAMIVKRERPQRVGYIVSGLGLIFVGLSVMSDAMSANADAMQALFSRVTNPFVLFSLGAVLTGLVQSSGATTSVIIAMSTAGLKVGTGGNEMLYIILGTNVGSCVTALLSSMGAGTNAKRTSLIHLMFNTFGSTIFFVVLLLCPSFMADTFARWFSSAATQIAMFHTFFNVLCTALFLPLSDGFVRLSKRLIPDREEEKEITYLDERMLATPALAIAQLKKETFVLAGIAIDAFKTSYEAFCNRDKEAAAEVFEKIDKAQAKNSAILSYLIKASSRSGEKPEKEISNIHRNIGDIMRIAEIADNFVKYTARFVDNELQFSETASRDIDNMVNKVKLLYGYTKEFVLTGNGAFLTKGDAIEQEIDDLRKKLIDDHIERLNAGQCQPETSSIYINLVSNVERLGDHLTYVAHSWEKEAK